MDSSDSEDDCYGNIAQKLQRMKNKYVEDKIESTNLLNESTEIDDVVLKVQKNEGKSDIVPKLSDKSSEKDESDCISIENVTVVPTKRVTRSTSKRSSSDISITETTLPKRSRKQRKTSKAATTETNVSIDNVNLTTNQTVQNTNQRSISRGRGRGRNRGRNVRAAINNHWNIPTYSVGNTDEYPDQCDNQQLFSSNKTSTDDVIIVEESEALDENEELSVKVYWQSSEFFKFTIRRYQKLTSIFEYFSKKENVSNDKLFLTFNDRILKPDDTPDSINYSIVKFIDGGIINQSVSQLVKNNSKEEKSGIKIKFQCQNLKKPFETVVSLDDKLSLALLKCAEHFETSIDKMKFEFDGDAVSGKTTARELELEGGECIDVKIIS